MRSDIALALRLARRELRAGTRGFRVFIACLIIGVAAIVGVGTLSSSITAGIDADARALLGGDIEMRLEGRAVTAVEWAYLRDNATAVSTAVEMRAMARRDGIGTGAGSGSGRSLIELKGVDDRYPLVGTAVVEPSLALNEALAKRNGVWGAVIAPSLASKLKLAVGDSLRVGEATFTVRGMLTREPDEVVSLFDLGPRVMIDLAALPDTQLIQPGSQFQYHYRLLLPAGVARTDWIARVEAALPRAGWRVRPFDEAAPGVRRFLDNMGLFLVFSGLTALLVGGIGVANAVGSYLESKTATIATMKCIGAPSRLVFLTYMALVLALAVAGIVIGLIIGAIAPLLGVAALEQYLPVTPHLGLFPKPLATGAAFGLLTVLTFALWPLTRATEVPAARLYRDQVAPTPVRRRVAALIAIGSGALGMAALTFVTAARPDFAAWFVGCSVATLLVLRGAGELVVGGARRLQGLRAVEWRLAVANLHRPGSTTPSIVVSLGLGLSVLVAVALIQGNLSQQIHERLPKRAPAFFFIDIQPDQVAAFDAAIRAVPGVEELRRVPTLRGRIVAIGGIPVERATVHPDSQWAVRGDRSFTYSAELPVGAGLVAGQWWPIDYAGPPLVSIDAAMARGFGVGVGDKLTLSILGRQIDATIGSLREIDWRSLRFDFAIIFSPGVLEGAPHTHIAAAQVRPEAEEAAERAGTDAFPNVSAIRVREALDAAARILEATSFAVRSTAGISIVSGVLVLAGAIAAGQRRRIYDSVVFKVLGATRRTMALAFLAEYGALGLLTGAIAAVVGTAIAWAVIVHLMKAEWFFLPSVVAVTVAASIVVTIAVGFAGTWRALGQKAAFYLRNE